MFGFCKKKIKNTELTAEEAKIETEKQIERLKIKRRKDLLGLIGEEIHRGLYSLTLYEYKRYTGQFFSYSFNPSDMDYLRVLGYSVTTKQVRSQIFPSNSSEVYIVSWNSNDQKKES